MCDFSLEHFASRDAKVGDALITRALGEHDTIGFTAPDDPDVAVCLLPGTRLVVTDAPDALRSDYSLSVGDSATFAQRTLPEGTVSYRDGLVFDHHIEGEPILLQNLLAGLAVTVEMIPGAALTEAPAVETVERVLEPA